MAEEVADTAVQGSLEVVEYGLEGYGVDESDFYWNSDMDKMKMLKMNKKKGCDNSVLEEAEEAEVVENTVEEEGIVEEDCDGYSDDDGEHLMKQGC